MAWRFGVLEVQVCGFGFGVWVMYDEWAVAIGPLLLSWGDEEK